MKKGLGAVAALALATSSAFAGSVSFNGPAVITPGTGSVSYDVSIQTSSLTGFDTMTMVFGTTDSVALTFVYDPAFQASATAGFIAAPGEQGIYAAFGPPGSSDVGVSANRFAPLSAWTAPLLVGTLTVDTSSLGQGSSATVAVDSDFELANLGTAVSLVQDGTGTQDALLGSVTISVVPEPATMLLLGIGGLVAARRRLA